MKFKCMFASMFQIHFTKDTHLSLHMKYTLTMFWVYMSTLTVSSKSFVKNKTETKIFLAALMISLDITWTRANTLNRIHTSTG